MSVTARVLRFYVRLAQRALAIIERPQLTAYACQHCGRDRRFPVTAPADLCVICQGEINHD